MFKNWMTRGKFPAGMRLVMAYIVVMAIGCAAGGTGQSSNDGGSGHPDPSGAGGNGGAGAGGNGGSPMSEPKRVFITKSVYTGNLASAGNAATGIEGGDNLCKLAAEAAVLGGTWKAWLSDANTNAIDRLVDVGPWHRVDRKFIVFNNKANIITGALGEINYDENGDLLTASGTDWVWTGTLNNGQKDPVYVTDCLNWTNGTSAGKGWIGRGYSAAEWTQYTYEPCLSKYHLYCFEQ